MNLVSKGLILKNSKAQYKGNSLESYYCLDLQDAQTHPQCEANG